MQTANRHIAFDDTAVKLDPDQTRHGAPVLVEGATARYYKLSSAPYGGRLEAEGTIYAEPWAYLYAVATAITSDGNGMAEFDGAPTLRAGDSVFVKHYGWHTVELDDEGPFPSGHAYLTRDRDGFSSLA
jgi:hypothetical protein